MTKIYDGNNRTTYTLNNGRVIALSNDEFDEIVVGSDKVDELHEKIKELKNEMLCKDKEIADLEDEVCGIGNLKAELEQYENSETIQQIVRLGKSNSIDAKDFLLHIKRTADAILKGTQNENYSC